MKPESVKNPYEILRRATHAGLAHVSEPVSPDELADLILEPCGSQLEGAIMREALEAWLEGTRAPWLLSSYTYAHRQVD